MEKMKQECKVKKPLKIWQGVLTLLVSAVILFVAAPRIKGRKYTFLYRSNEKTICTNHRTL